MEKEIEQQIMPVSAMFCQRARRQTDRGEREREREG